MREWGKNLSARYNKRKKWVAACKLVLQKEAFLIVKNQKCLLRNKYKIIYVSNKRPVFFSYFIMKLLRYFFSVLLINWKHSRRFPLCQRTESVKYDCYETTSQTLYNELLNCYTTNVVQDVANFLLRHCYANVATVIELISRI